MHSYIKQLQRHVRQRSKGNLSIRAATLIDIWLLLKLMLRGSFHAVVAEDLGENHGRMSLLKHLVWFFLRQSVNLDLKNQSVFVISKQHADFGLIQVERKRNTVGSEIYEINTVAIIGGPRQSTHAALVVKSMIDLLTKGSLLMAYCNGHSEEWKNALSRLHFSKQESLLDGIDLFSYEKSDANRSTKFVSMNLLQGAGDFLKFCA